MRNRRSWTVDEKRSICLETTEDGVSVAAVARRHKMNSNLIFKWLRDPRYAPKPPNEPAFLPVDIVPAQMASSGVCSKISVRIGGKIDLALEGAFSPSDIGALVRELSL